MPNLTSALNLLQQERNRLSSQLESLSNAISALRGTSGTGRTMSVAGRARIAAAQRARWAKAKVRKSSPSPSVEVVGCLRRLWLASEQRRNPVGQSGERLRRSAEGLLQV